MRKIGKQPLRLSLIALLFIVALSLLPFPCYATGRYVVNCLIAYDEEWASNAFWFYAYTAEELARIIFWDATAYFRDEFAIDFAIVAYTFWDSFDSPANPDIMMDEMIRETNFVSGMSLPVYNGASTVHLLIGFTDQDIPSLYGYVDFELGVILCAEYTTIVGGQHTDNILQHELSHLYGITEADEHNIEGFDCVMNHAPYWLPFPDHHFIPYALITNSWCDACSNTIRTNIERWGYYTTSPSQGGGSGRIYMTPKGDYLMLSTGGEDENI